MTFDPPTISVPVLDGEPGLMAALENVVLHYDVREGVNVREAMNLDADALARAVDWLAAKYGSRRG